MTLAAVVIDASRLVAYERHDAAQKNVALVVLEQLADGTATLSSGASALIDGVTALRDGAMQLSDGLKQLNEEGFQKLVDAMDGDVEPLLERARALAGISGDYQTYSGLDAAMDGSVKFIYRTEAIG